jgi:hypothetical protein
MKTQAGTLLNVLKENEITSLSIGIVRKLVEAEVLPSTISVGGNMEYGLQFFKDGNVALYRKCYDPKQRWQFIQVTFKKELLSKVKFQIPA